MRGVCRTLVLGALAALVSAQAGVEVDETEDQAAFSDANLPRYAAVAFVLTSGDVLADGQRAELQRFIRAGGGFIGVHSATDTERSWPWYGQLLGAWSSAHPEIQAATLDVVEPRDPSTEQLPARWTRRDQWINFDRNPRASGVRVLLTVDETTYLPREGAMGADHPVAWSHEFEGGRAWYTALGHTAESYSEPLFLAHLLGGIRWAARLPAVETPVAAETGSAASRKAPRIVSVATSVRGKRIVVTLRHANCGRCTGQMRLGARTTALRVTATGASAVTARLPSGRWQLTLVLRETTSGLSATARRWVRVGAPPR
jgi:type 1 glutamine amidotransferase